MCRFSLFYPFLYVETINNLIDLGKCFKADQQTHTHQQIIWVHPGTLISNQIIVMFNPQ